MMMMMTTGIRIKIPDTPTTQERRSGGGRGTDKGSGIVLSMLMMGITGAVVVIVVFSGGD